MDQPQGPKPALTVIIQSWWTPALAVIMLVVGLVVGFVVRPLVGGDPAATPPIAAVTQPVVAAPAATIPGVTVPTPTINPTIAAINSSEQFMAYIVSQTRHFQGDANAPITLIEFSDFQ